VQEARAQIEETTPGPDVAIEKVCPVCESKSIGDEDVCKSCGETLKPVDELGSTEAGVEEKAEELGVGDVQCHQCGGKIDVPSSERPVKVTCPHCGTEGLLE
jgi:predicted RNA-binding Zn-ribbon protein involved in translation (DUF1610 family)